MFLKILKNILLPLVFITFSVFNINIAWSGFATPSAYIVTVNSMDLCENASCSQYTRIGEITKSFDIAGVSAAGDVGTYVDEITLEVGKTYTHARWNINRAMTMKGTVAIDGLGNCATSADGTAGVETVTAYTAVGDTEANLALFIVDIGKGGDGTWPKAADYKSKGLQLVSNDFPFATTFDFIIKITTPYTVTENVPEISMSFDVTDNLGAGYNNSGGTQNGVPNAKCYYWVEDPSPSITIK